MLLSAVFAALVGAPPVPDTASGFKFQDGDRIVWLGNTLVEREQRYGYWETALLAANKDKNITVRNLGWSGDTVYGDARAGFDNPAKGFERMVSLALELKPTVIFISYGANEAFEGKEGLPKFEKGLEKLLDALKPANARLVLFTPMAFEPLNKFPFAEERNKQLAAYSEVIQKVGKARELYVADLFKSSQNTYSELASESGGTGKTPQLTENGLHLTDDGYYLALQAFGPAIGFRPRNGFALGNGTYEPLRKAVIAKNELFFYRWRPQNETYLFGFRKHEQGKNAKEVAEFDPLVSKAEDVIARIRKALK
jgi:lysophospholipase L1-like esterase